MSWYISHAIFIVEVISGEQDEYPVWENIFLIEADDDVQALERALVVAREHEQITREMKYGDEPAHCVFKGIRQLIGTSDSDSVMSIRLEHGEELSYCYYEVDSKDVIDRLLDGKLQRVLYGEIEDPDE